MKKSFHVFFLFVLFSLFAVNTAWADQVSLSTDPDDGGLFVNMPLTGTSTVNITADDIAKGVKTFKVYDDGGKDGDFSSDADGFLLLNVPEGYKLVMLGTSDMGPIEDPVGVYSLFDGNSTEDDFIFINHSYSEDIGVRVSTGNAFLLQLRAYGGDRKGASGFDFTVTVMKDGEVVAKNLSGDGEGGFYVNMPMFGTNSIDLTDYIANGGTSFKVYDDGGWDGGHCYYASEYLQLSVPEGYTLFVSGNVRTGMRGKLIIYDGNSVEATPLVNGVGGFNIAGLASTGSAMLFYFSSTESRPVSYDGFDLTVQIVKTAVDLADDGEGGYYVNMPKISTQNVTIPAGVTSFKVYDDGGKDGNYTGKARGKLVLNAPEGAVIKVEGTSTLKNAFVIIDDENGSKYGPLGSDYNSEISHDVSYLSTDNSVIITFTSENADYTSSGLDFTVTVFLPKSIVVNNPAIGGTAESDKTNAVFGQTVSLTATPSNGYLLSDVVLKDDDGQILEQKIDVDWYSNTATFRMPDANVSATPIFTDNFSAFGGLYVDLPKTGTKNVTIPVGVTSFKVYDDGGKNENYTIGANGYLVLTAPAGYRFVLQGSMDAYNGGSKGTLEVYDGDGSSSKQKILEEKGDVSGIYVYSSGNTMTIRFRDVSGVNSPVGSGLDFTVTVFTPHGVNIAGATGGKVTTSKETADEGTAVTLTATPNEGYMLNGISVVDIDGKLVDGTWNIGANTFTFNMPAEAVLVTPLFVPVGDVFVNMPKTGNMEVVIPEGVESIKVYDDGGKDGNYSDQSNAILQLVAPENYVFQISGSVSTEVTRDFLEIYDGAYNSDKKLLDGKSGSIDLNGANILTSLNNIITINFYSDSYGSMEGFDFKVTLVKPTYGAVSIAKADDGKIHATINGDYEGTEKLSIPEAIEVDAIDYNRELDVETPVTALLPVTLPAGTTVNADFYTLEKVEQVEGMKWQATMTYIGKNNLPQPNTPYAVILPEGQTKLEFNLNGKKATVQTGEIKKVCGLSDCTLDENEQITDDWFFTGTYAYKQWNTGDEELGLAYAFAASDNPYGAAKGKFGKIKAGAFANATRCYLRKRDAKVKLQQQNQAQMVAASPYVARYSINNLPETIDVEFVKNDEKGGRTVLRGRMNTVTGEFKMLRDYDLKGRKVNGVNKARGAYYGKKVLKK